MAAQVKETARLLAEKDAEIDQLNMVLSQTKEEVAKQMEVIRDQVVGAAAGSVCVSRCAPE